MQKVPVGNLFKYGFFALCIFEMGRSLYEVVFSESLNNSEKILTVGKKLGGYAIDILFGYKGTEAGVKIALTFCITWTPGTIIIGALAGAAFGFLEGKIVNLLKFFHLEIL